MVIVGKWNKYIVQTVTFGMVLAGFSVLLTIIVGFTAAIYTPGHSTEVAMKAVYIYTVPYSIFGGLGYYLYKIKNSRVINSTFNIGALTLVAMWVGIILLRTTSATFLSADLNLVVIDNFTSSAVVAGLLSGLMLLESYLIH